MYKLEGTDVLGPIRGNFDSQLEVRSVEKAEYLSASRTNLDASTLKSRPVFHSEERACLKSRRIGERHCIIHPEAAGLLFVLDKEFVTSFPVLGR